MLQPVQVKLQQEKQALQEQLAATVAHVKILQQQIADQQQQLQQQQQQLLELQSQIKATKEGAIAAEAKIQRLLDSQATAAHDADQEGVKQQQQVQELQLQLANTNRQHAEQVQGLQQHLQWLCNMYLAAPAISGQQQSHSCQETNIVVEAPGDCCVPAVAAAAVQLRQITGNDTETLETRYAGFLKHKEQLLQNKTANTGKLQCLQQQTLQLEAGLLQLMLCLQSILQQLEGQQQQQQHAGQQRSPAASFTEGQQTRPWTASSRCTDTSSSDSVGHGGLARQLLQVLTKEKKQLAQQVKKLQNQQAAQHTDEHAGACRSSTATASSCPATMVGLAHVRMQAAEPGNTVSCCSTLLLESGDDDVSEVLKLLKGCQLACPHSTSKALGAAGRSGLMQHKSAPQQPAISKGTDPPVDSRLLHDYSLCGNRGAPATTSPGLKKSCSTSSSPGHRGIASLRPSIHR